MNIEDKRYFGLVEMPKEFLWMLEEAASDAGEEARVEKEMGNPEKLRSGYLRAEKDLSRLSKMIAKTDPKKIIEVINNLPTVSKDRIPTKILQYLGL